MFSTPVIIFAFIGFLGVNCEAKLCDFADSKCLTAGSNRMFNAFVLGSQGVEPSDPLKVDVIEGNLPNLNFKAVEAVLSGMKYCKVDHVGLSAQDDKYNYNIACPRLTLTLKNEVNGEVGSEHVEGKANCQADLTDYVFKFNGDFSKSQDGNGKLHMNLKTHTLALEVKGSTKHACKNTAGDLSNEKWQSVGNVVGQLTLENLMNKYIDNVNAYLDKVPVEDLFSQE